MRFSTSSPILRFFRQKVAKELKTAFDWRRDPTDCLSRLCNDKGPKKNIKNNNENKGLDELNLLKISLKNQDSRLPIKHDSRKKTAIPHFMRAEIFNIASIG